MKEKKDLGMQVYGMTMNSQCDVAMKKKIMTLDVLGEVFPV